MTADFVVLCAAGMLVSGYLMVGQKALFMAIRLFGLQSILLGAIAVGMALEGGGRFHLLATAALTIGLKGLVIPWFLMRVIDRVGIHREVEPILNVPSSLLLCALLTVIAYRLSAGFPFARDPAAHHLAAVALAIVFTGLFLMVTRRKAVSQILGLLTLENGVFLAAVGTTTGMPLIVELGISFDVLLAVVVLGVLVRRIVDRFESMDVSRLSSLKG